MKSQIYAIFDQASGIYEKPFFSTTDQLVMREFQDIVLANDHPIARHAEHYSLWRLGNFDNNTGKVLNEDNECLCTGLEAKARAQNVDKQQMEIFKNSMTVNDDPQYKPGMTD